MSRVAWLLGASIAAAVPMSLTAQEAPADPMATARQSAVSQVAEAREAVGGADTGAAPVPCKPKKKKGFGLGGILKAASKTGLTSMVGGGLLGQGGSLAGAAINTGVSVAEGNPGKPKPDIGC